MKRKMFLIGTMALMFASGIFWSCQKDEFEIDSENESMLKKAKITQVSSVVDWVPQVCAGVEHSFTLQGWTGTKNVGIQIYDESISEWISVPGLPNGQVSSPQDFTYTFPADGTYQLRYSVSGNADDGGTNGQKVFTVTVSNCGCDESFSYVENANGSYTFTYVPAEDMDATAVVFTFAQGSYVSGLDGWDNNGVTFQREVSFTACTPVSWTVALQANCNGKGQSKANVWTDFKVNNESKKGENNNIELPCTE